MNVAAHEHQGHSDDLTGTHEPMKYFRGFTSCVLALCLLTIPFPAHPMDLQTEFMVAVKWRDIPRTGELLQRGADVNRPDEEGITALCWACAGGQEDVVELLLTAGAEVNKQGRFGSTALHCAAGWGHVKVVGRLIERGADVNARDQRNQNALSVASMRGHVEVVKFLASQGAGLRGDLRGRGSPLLGAAQYGQTNIVDVLLTAGADINEKDELGRTPLMIASYRGLYETVELLLARGAGVRSEDSHGNTALILATSVGDPRVVETLLNKGADPLIRNDVGVSPLAVASKRGDVGLIGLFATLGAPAEARKEARVLLDQARGEGRPAPSSAPYEPPTTPRTVVAEVPEKVCQLVGEYDRERQSFTGNRTMSRYGLAGTDLGVPFEHKGRTYLLFGDSIGIHGGDCIAHTNATNLDHCVDLEFVDDGKGSYKPVEIPGISQDNMEVPIEGVSVNGNMYTYHTTDFSTRAVVGRTVVAVSRDDGRTFEYLYDLSRRHFLNVSVVETDVRGQKGLPESVDRGLFIFGSGQWRKSDVRLAFQPSAKIEASASIRYFAGLDSAGMPAWSQVEADARPLFRQSCVGELSAAYVGCLNKWIILYNCEASDMAVYMRTADRPWGPWSEPQLVYEPSRDSGLCRFIHQTWASRRCDILHEPGRENLPGVVYGPYLFEHRIVGDPRNATIYFTLSTWNPYTVVLMKTKLRRID